MKLSDHVEHIRQLIDTAFRNRLGRMGIAANGLQPANVIPAEYQADRKRIEPIRETLIAEMGTVVAGYEKLVEEFTFTLFNRIAALKVMEAHTLHPEIVTRRSQHGDRSFAHRQWLEEHPAGRNEEMEGLVSFISDEFGKLTSDIPLFSLQHPYHLLPTVIELNGIINAFNAVEADEQVEADIWKSDDVLGWLYESYNNYKKAAHKDSGAKTEYNKVSIQSQVYTPRWVVKFLVDNSLGKLYLEMFPDSDIRNRYKIANAPKTQTKEPKPLTEIRLIDPATGSGNFLLYAFDLFFDLYKDQIENYGADYDDRKIPELIIAHNLHGVDLDDRAVQIAQLGLYIKAKRKKRGAKIEHFNIVSSDFYLPDYAAVKDIFEANGDLDEKQKKVIRELWADLQQAYKFGALIRIEEKMSLHTHALVKQFEGSLFSIVSKETIDEVERFKHNFFANLHKAVTANTAKQGQTFLNVKTQDAITFLQLLTQKYDVAVANPPYTPSAEYGEELKFFIENNYKEPTNTYENLYGCFTERAFELTNDSGYIAMITPQTFMFIDSFKTLRNLILKASHINILVQYGYGGIFKESVDPCFYILSKKQSEVADSLFLKFDTSFGNSKKMLFQNVLDSKFDKSSFPDNIYYLDQQKFFLIKGQPFIYWISDLFRSKFQKGTLDKYLKVCQGLATGDNNRFLRFHWEIKSSVPNNKWIPYAKGGTFNKWYGNLWLTVNWENDGHAIKNFRDEKGKLRSRPQNEAFYLKKGITYSASGRGGYAFRLLPEGSLFDVGGSSIFLTNQFSNIEYALGLLNSKFAYYVADCLNPTANIQVGDIQRIPFVAPTKALEGTIALCASQNIADVKKVNNYRITEPNYSSRILSEFQGSTLKEKLNGYLEFETRLKTQVILREAIIDDLVIKVYDLTPEDYKLIEAKLGPSLGNLPVSKEAKRDFLSILDQSESEVLFTHVERLEEGILDEAKLTAIISALDALYQGKNDLEDFCYEYSINPIDVWALLNTSKKIPAAKAREVAIEFLIDCVSSILMEDKNGVIPLYGLSNEPSLSSHLEQYCINVGFTMAQFMQLESLLNKSINEYLYKGFFVDLSEEVNLFSNLPKTPFIWHLSSGEYQGFEAYIIIYKWNRDSLYRLKSSYLNKRTESLNYRLQQIGTSNTAQAQTEKELIRKQLQEIDGFSKKIDELIAEGYDPKLDDGVGKNIAPLQKKGMLKAEVLNKKQLEKYLNADW